MKYVYIIRSLKNSDCYYTGITDDLDARLLMRNAGEVKPTKAFIPWRIETYVGFQDSKKAFEFEKYLKSGSGRSFTKRHL